MKQKRFPEQTFGYRTFATPEIRREEALQRAEALEKTLPKGLWSNPSSPTDLLEVLVDAWEETGFAGWSDNYRADAVDLQG